MPMSVVYTTVNGQVQCENRGGVVSHFVSDPLGSVVMVRDNSGNTVYEAEYDPYGNVQSEAGTNHSEFGYVGTFGYVKDSASSLYVRARYLLTNLGRWLTKDPLWPSEPGFVYAGAAPVSSTDLNGLQAGNILDDWGGMLCRAACWALGAAICALAALSCVVGTMITIGLVTMPCAVFIVLMCALGAAMASLCSDGCGKVLPPRPTCYDQKLPSTFNTLVNKISIGGK